MFIGSHSRRDFLRLGAAGVAAAAMPGFALAKDDDEFAGFNGEADIVDGEGLLVLPAQKAFDRTRKSGLLFVGAKGFGQAVDFNHWHGCSVESRKAGVECGMVLEMKN